MDLKRKLSSRKFWVALVGFITPLMVAFNCTQEQITQVTAIVMGGATFIAYILSEGYVDGKSQEGDLVADYYLVTEDEDDADDYLSEEELAGE